MHKSHHTTKPCANKLLQQKWDDYEYEKHRASLVKAKPKVDTSAPKKFQHLAVKSKRVQIEEERLAIIERDNRILLEKISSVMRARGNLDNRLDFNPTCSLNREKRQRELLRVARENERIVKRILSTETQLSRDKMEKDWAEVLKALDRISRYPKEWWLEDEKNNRSSSDHGRGRSNTQPEDRSYSDDDRDRDREYDDDYNDEDGNKDDDGNKSGDDNKDGDDNREQYSRASGRSAKSESGEKAAADPDPAEQDS